MPGSVRQGPAPSCPFSAARHGAQTSVGGKPEACPQEALQEGLQALEAQLAPEQDAQAKAKLRQASAPQHQKLRGGHVASGL